MQPFIVQMLTNPQCKQEDEKHAVKREKPCEKHQGTKKQRPSRGLAKSQNSSGLYSYVHNLTHVTLNLLERSHLFFLPVYGEMKYYFESVKQRRVSSYI